jgi:hypothetical protein
MSEWLQHPAFQAGIAPLVVALVVGFALRGTRYAWLGVVAAYATLVAQSTGFSFDPLTAGRKVLLLSLLAPIVGIAIDATGAGRVATGIATVGFGAASLWTFQSVLTQRTTQEALMMGGGIALFVMALVALMLRLRDDGLRTGASGVGLGLAAGIAALLSASIGYFMAGIAIAAGAGAMMLVQLARREPIAAGALGALSIAVPVALGAAGTFMLAQLPWYALPALVLVPAFVPLPSPANGGIWVRSIVFGVVALVAAAVPVLAAWLAARGGLS